MNSQYLWIVPILVLLCCVSCAEKEYDYLFTATLVSAEYHYSGGWGSMAWWELRFDNNTIVLIREYRAWEDVSTLLFIEGKEYSVFQRKGRYYKLEEK